MLRYIVGRVALALAVLLTVSLIVFLASNVATNGLLDEDRDNSDWIEIYNRGSNAVNLAGWSLSDDPEVPGMWVFGSRILNPGQYVIVFASGCNADIPQA